MNRLQNKLKSLREQGRKALVMYLSAGYPNLKTTEELVPLLEKSGADIIELGVPFSDPVADGPTIQYSSEIALKNGASLTKILELVSRLRKRTQIPIVLMSYLNPLYRNGLAGTIERAKLCGVDGLIIPDVIPEESKEAKDSCRKNGISLVFLAAPNTPAKRLSYIDDQSDSFVYIVSLLGVTGARKALPPTIKEYLLNTKAMIKHPRIIGFGISSPAHVTQVKNYVDGIIVASALIDIMRNNTDKKQLYRKTESFVRSLRSALDDKKIGE